MNFEDRMKLEELYKYEECLKNRIWNLAIEAAAKIAYDNRDHSTYVKIRKLKKDDTD